MGAVWLSTLGLGLALMTAAPPPRVQLPKAVCTPHGACITLKEEGRTEEGLLILRLDEKLPARIAEKRAFGLWLAWPRDAEQRSQFPSLQPPFQTAMTTPEGRLELFIPAEVLVRRTPDEPPAFLVHVSFDPVTTGAPKAPVHELIVAAQEHKLLDDKQRQDLELRQKAFEAMRRALLAAMKDFLAHPSDPKKRSQFLSSLGTVPVSPFADPEAACALARDVPHRRPAHRAAQGGI